MINEKDDRLKLRLIGWYFLAFLYLVIRFGFTRQLDSLGNYGSYFFEILCVSVAIVLFGKKFFSLLKITKSTFYGLIIALGAGFGTFKVAGSLNITVPFDLNGTETILFLLIVAPILEEMIFRFLLWQPIQRISQRPMFALIATSLIFSYSHLHAIWFVLPEVHNFIIYQAVYTLLLGLACGFYIYRYSSLTSAVLIHFAFNLGFYLAVL